jgi:hypothetical protein
MMAKSAISMDVIWNVAVVAERTSDGAKVGALAQDIFSLLAQGNVQVVPALRLCSRKLREDVWAVVTVENPHHGFGYAYFRLLPAGDVRLFVGGFAPESFEPPMPVPGRELGALVMSAMGMGTSSLRPVDVIEELSRLAGSLPECRLDDGWYLDGKALIELHDAASPHGSQYRLANSGFSEEG